ncbi:unnamed protein product [Fraxinus pennsylvanica]|uniref:NADH-ubiquinone oxidoreductase chain 6 n=1 Tax=Fraxinus pennsylvanica TaxID=56036 RepID=A0AAD2E4J2_9LAMI|nr:unnamed protein product [Fraxinus pennsylvanica]
MVARAKNPVHSVLFPIPVFCDTSGLLLLLGLDFSAMIFPVVHIGAIAVSFLFVVMMFNIQIAEIHEEVLRYLPVSGIIGLIFWWEMFFILDNESIPLLPTQRNTTSLRYTVYAEKNLEKLYKVGRFLAQQRKDPQHKVAFPRELTLLKGPVAAAASADSDAYAYYSPSALAPRSQFVAPGTDFSLAKNSWNAVS